YGLAPTGTTAAADGDGFRLNGGKAVVPGGDAARWVAVAAAPSAGPALFWVDAEADGVTRTTDRLIDGRGAADLRFADVALDAGARLNGADALAALAEIEDWAVAASLAETLGAMERARDLTHEYLQTRQQFGRPIGKFQVLQHGMADILSEVEFAKSMVFWAAAELDNPDARARRHAVSGAKVFVDAASRRVAEAAVQMHGGVGVTDEYALTHYVKRLTLGQVLFGDRDEHLLRYQETAA
ncbi:MAG: acyl-CoA dehydrogenase, partial [Rhodospirillaceae bacterium]